MLLAMDVGSVHSCSRTVCIKVIFSVKLKTFRANFTIFVCKGNCHFSVDHSTGKLVSNLVINNSPEEAQTWLLSHSSLKLKAASCIPRVFVDDFNICVTLITKIAKSDDKSVLLFIILKLIQQGI